MGKLFDKESSSSGGSSSSSTSTTVNDLLQSGQLGNLLANADKWLEAGGIGAKPDLSGNMGALLEAMGSQYMDILSGKPDDAALQNMLQSQANAAQQTLDRNILPSIGTASNMTGSAGGSRRGIAEGLAASDMSNQLLQQQQQTIYDFNNQQTANKFNAAQGLGNMFGQIGALQESMQGNTAGANALENLLAYKELISGNMGGTTTTNQNSTSNQWGNNTQHGGFNEMLGGLATIGSFFPSDEGLKKNIKTVKNKRTGKPIKFPSGALLKSWEWNEEANDKYGLTGKSMGVIAQDVQKKKPSAVSKNKRTGDKMVDYGKV